jgi:hypothetical protein
MVGLVLTPEQVRSAPPEVREWIKGLVEAELAGEFAHPRCESGATLAACSRDEAAAILERIRGDYLASQVFFELGRDSPPEMPQPPQLHRIAIVDIMRHTRLANLDQLSAYLAAIQETFRAVRNDPAAALFAFDQRGGCYTHETTHQSIKRLWLDLVMNQMPAMAVAGPPGDPAAAPVAAGLRASARNPVSVESAAE